jgi:rSAM/selenodomain-associated transferase 2
MSRVSIIIPVVNEATVLGRTLRQLQLLDPPAWEVLVVDGLSQDQTVSIAAAAGIRVLSCDRRGRSIQMNYGANAATGDMLCFLHADTWVPSDLITLIEQTLADPKIACGGFVAVMAGDRTTRWGISLHNYLKTYYAPLLFRPHLFFQGLRLLFGDQTLFCRAVDFHDCGKFDQTLPIMEDGDLCLRLFRKGRICQVNRVVFTSDRRVARWGALKATAIYLYIGMLWGVGVSTAYLKKFYEDVR